MKILLSNAVVSHGAFHHWMTADLRALGHEVDTIDPDELCEQFGIELWRRVCLQRIAAERPHVLMVYPPYDLLRPQDHDLIRAMGTVVVGFAYDDPIFLSSYKYAPGDFERITDEFLRTYDIYLTTSRELVRECENRGIKGFRHIRWACNTPGGYPDTVRDIPLMMIGAPYPRRVKMVKFLKDHGVPPVVFGAEGWKHFLDVADLYHGMLTRPGMFESYRRAKVALAPCDWESLYTPMVKLRSLEISVCGPLQICEEAEDLADYYEKEKEVASYPAHDWETLVKLIREYLSDEPRRQQVARAGFDRTVRDHVWKVRWKEIEDLVLPILERIRRPAAEAGAGAGGKSGKTPKKQGAATAEPKSTVDLPATALQREDAHLPHELGLAACALHYERMGDAATALGIYNELGKLSPDSYTMALGKGRVQLALKQFDDAEKTLLYAKQCAASLNMRGVDSTVTQRKLGPRNGLGKLFTGIFPRVLEANAHLLILYSQTDRMDKAEQLMIDLSATQDLLFVSIVSIIAEPNVDQLLTAKYVARYVEVLLTCEPVVWMGEKIRHMAHFWMLRGQALGALGQRDEARQCLEYALTQNPYPQVEATIRKQMAVVG